MMAFLYALLARLVAVLLPSVLGIVGAAVACLTPWGQGMLHWFFVQVFKATTAILGALSFGSLDLQTLVDALPSQMLRMFDRVGVGEALSIVFAAMVLRLTLQLIPFTRLGS